MKSYFVTWEIDIDAENPRDAALKALEIQRRVGSAAVVFDVIESDSDGEKFRIDLDESSDLIYHECTTEEAGITCDECGKALEKGEPIVEQPDTSHPKYFHEGCTA